MTEAIWLSLGVAAVATAVMSVGGVWLTKRSAARPEQRAAERAPRRV